jgi:hypothetical protein
MDQDQDPGGPKTCGSGSGFGTLVFSPNIFQARKLLPNGEEAGLGIIPSKLRSVYPSYNFYQSKLTK